MEIKAAGDAVAITRQGETEIRRGSPPAVLKELAAARRSPVLSYLPAFTGGFVGYFAYEYIRCAEPALHLTDRDEIGFHDFHLLMFDKVIAFDHLRQKIQLIAHVAAEDLERSYAEGAAALREMEHLITSSAPARPPVPAQTPRFVPSMSPEDFYGAAEKIKGHIFEGDVFQCVPSIRFKSPFAGDLLQTYRVLRTTNPSAYMFYISFQNMELAGASPETLVSLKNGVARAYPLAGSCPRTADAAETDRLIAELLRDGKELAEHDMLVDLARNDLGKICEFGSVRVEEYRGVKKLSHVCHIASKISGRIAKDYDALDAIAAVLPAGTLSGAPKKRACEIIDAVENAKRGPYGGAVGYIDFNGGMDLCIGIRMAVLKDNQVYAQAGAGIVADSDPAKEYQECLRKAAAVIEAVETAGKAVLP
jgi:anthranilate synthase component 1